MPSPAGGPRARKPTTTSNFGVGLRESHDASGFYGRFTAPVLSDDETVLAPFPIDEPFRCGDSRALDLPDGSVALVVTSPPYFAGKQYEEELEAEGVPSSYLEYLELLRDVFAECARVLEPGGRIAINVANLGRKPYRSLAADVITILQDLGLLLRGEVVWQKGEGASGSCAWGSFRGASNPVLRDITERVVIASKGRFDRARTAKQRAKEGLPHKSTVLTEDFLGLTLDVWSIPPESAKRVGHPAPFPVELPEQLINLYTYEDDLVLDPFMGSGSTMVAAHRTGRRYVGCDLDPAYVEIARKRVVDDDAAPVVVVGDGRKAGAVALEAVAAAGFTVVAEDKRIRGTGIVVPIVATDAAGQEWWFDVAGPYVQFRGGLLRTEVVWRALGRAHALRTARADRPLVVLTTDLPKRSTEGDQAIRAAGPEAIFDLVDLRNDEAVERLATYAAGGAHAAPLAGFWA